MSRDFDQIVNAIQTVRENSDGDLRPHELAAKVGKSKTELDQLFERWAGVDITMFFRYLRPDFIKSQLNRKVTLFDNQNDSSASNGAITPNQFIEIEPMKSDDLSHGTEIFYSTGQTEYGEILIGSTGQGICLISFMDGKLSTEDFISTEIQNGIPVQQQRDIHVETVKFFQGNLPEGSRLKLHLMGTPFQISVWRALLEIWPGRLITYGELANGMGKPNASRAVGSVIGQNHIAYLIPCHRVVASTGIVGNFRWGSDRKAAMIAKELSQKEKARLR